MNSKMSVVAIVSACGAIAAAQPSVRVAPIPTPIVPTGTDIRGLDFLAPGAFPATLTATKIDLVTDPAGGVLDGQNSNYVRFVGVPLGDPMSGATNEGDVDINISLNASLLDPSNPRSDFAFPNTNWDPIVGEQASFSPSSGGEPSYGWAATTGAGVLIPQIADNGRDNGFDAFGEPTGTLFAHAQAAANSFRGGAGYNMLTGEFSNGNGTIFTSIHALGFATEYVIDVAYAWFPFQEGWIAATTSGGNPPAWSERTTAPDPSTGLDVAWPSRGPDLPDDASEIVSLAGTGNAQGTIDFTSTDLGVTPGTAMLFVRSADDTNNAVLPNIVEVGDAWNYAFRKDDWFPGVGSDEFASEGNGDLTFVAIPYSAPNLQGGAVDANGSYTRQADDNTTTITRTANGTYELTVPGPGAETGMLLLQPTLAMDGDPTDPNRNVLSYEYDASSDVYVIESRILADGDNVFFESYPLIDSSFYVAFIDFANPPTPPVDGDDCPADLTGPDGAGDPDGVLDANDFFFYLGLFAAGDAGADLTDAGGSGNPDGIIDANDFFFYLQLFAAGCP